MTRPPCPLSGRRPDSQPGAARGRPLGTLSAGCKVNLFLHVREQRPDGFHNLETLFLPLKKPYDSLEILLTDKPEGSLGVVVQPPAFPMDPANNTLTAAYSLFAEATGFAPPLEIHLKKRIPMGAGLGGGSSDAAALLRHLQALAAQCGQRALTAKALAALAARVGADVPFFLQQFPAFASGIGETLTRAANPFAGNFLLLVCPRVKVSTPWAYRALAEARKAAPGRNAQPGPSLSPYFTQENSCQALTRQTDRDTRQLALQDLFTNSFETVVFEAFPELARIKQTLLDQGAIHALMSGSGSSLFGIFRTRSEAKLAENALEPFKGRVFLQRV